MREGEAGLRRVVQQHGRGGLQLPLGERDDRLAQRVRQGLAAEPREAEQGAAELDDFSEELDLLGGAERLLHMRERVCVCGPVSVRAARRRREEGREEGGGDGREQRASPIHSCTCLEQASSRQTT